MSRYLEKLKFLLSIIELFLEKDLIKLDVNVLKMSFY